MLRSQRTAASTIRHNHSTTAFGPRRRRQLRPHFVQHGGQVTPLVGAHVSSPRSSVGKTAFLLFHVFLTKAIDRNLRIPIRRMKGGRLRHPSRGRVTISFSALCAEKTS